MMVSRIEQFVPLKKVGTVISTKVAGDSLKIDGVLDQGGNHLVNSGSVNAQNAKGAGYHLDGDGDIITIPHNTSIEVTDKCTIESIFKVGVTAENQFLYAKGNGIVLDPSADGTVIKFSMNGGTNKVEIPILEGELNHAFGLYDGEYIYTDINGIESALTSAGIPSENATSVTIGNSVALDRDVNGDIFQTRLWNRELSTVERKSLSSGAPVDFADIGADNFELWDTDAAVFTSQDVTIDNGAGYSIGANSMTVDPLLLALPVGTKLTFASGGEYILTTTAAASTTTIISTSGLTGFAVVDGEAAPSGTYAWVAEGNNTIANVANALEITYVDHANGAFVSLSDSYDLQSNLMVGKQYRLTYTASYIGGTTTSLIIYDGATSILQTITESPTVYTLEFIAHSATACLIRGHLMSAGNVITFDNLSIKRIGCVLQLEQDGIGHNQWLDKSYNENHGAVTGAIPTNLEANDIERYRHTVAITDDTTWTSVVPAGYMLESITFLSDNVNVATIDLGTTSTGQDVFEQQVIAGSGLTTVVINKVFSMTAAQSLYLNDDGAGTWNGASLTATLLMKRMV